jgi:formylmethanofuran dehydrogenase subunit A
VIYGIIFVNVHSVDAKVIKYNLTPRAIARSFARNSKGEGTGR